MKRFALFIVLVFASAALAQDAPRFFKDTYPGFALPSALEARGILQGKDAKRDPKVRELIALGVAAQVPCSYCVYYHTKAAMLYGATDDEVREAVAAAATVRQWSTVLNGRGYDLDAFKAEVDQLFKAKE